MTNVINGNRLPDFIFKSVANLNSQRIISLALPLLSLNPITAQLSSIGIGLYQCHSMWMNKDAKTFTGYKWADTALLASSIALSFYFPMIQLAFSSGAFFLTHGYQLITKKSKELTALQMAQHAVHLASLCYRTPLLMGISLVSQAGTEIVQAYHEERTPERCVNLLMAAIRLYSAFQYLPRQPSQATAPVQEENKQVENKLETVEEMRDKTPILSESNPTVENDTVPTHDLPPQAEVPAPQVETRDKTPNSPESNSTVENETLPAHEKSQEVYPNNLKNREFDKKGPQNFCSERVTIAEKQGTSENKNLRQTRRSQKPILQVVWV
ncbi:MAG TPA: hypothetical protein VFU89_07585 [Rhabdochlamydiaceae bacterium]|nr:hypothetical protein [Rhabdochlamydiaceae bacterium]